MSMPNSDIVGGDTNRGVSSWALGSYISRFAMIEVRIVVSGGVKLPNVVVSDNQRM